MRRSDAATDGLSGRVRMYKKILVLTDSAISTAAAIKGVGFAKEIGAEVVALYVAPEYISTRACRGDPRPTCPQEYETTMKKAGEVHLKSIHDAASNGRCEMHACDRFLRCSSTEDCRRGAGKWLRSDFHGVARAHGAECF